MSKKVRVRFAPSPTGGLHLGGVRTVLFNYLFARQHKGHFILRIEDTDQNRYVPGAEEYIFDCLKWAGLEPDESVVHGGAHGPYRQSERKELYRQYAEKLVADGVAYYAFDTPEELEQMRERYKSHDNPQPQYDHSVRMKMHNSLTHSPAEVRSLIDAGNPHVIRLKMPVDEKISFTDMIRGEVSFDSSLSDDKVLLKADGMPTYHLAVVVDDHLMEISHAFRGEEWLPSAPVHILLWKYLFGLEKMPQWAHFPLIMGPNGKLSKRDGAKYGFPVFAMNWQDPVTGEVTEGFREKGFLQEGFRNLLAMLGWNDGTEQEIFDMDELISKFSMERVHSAGAKFDYEKAKWFNHEWIKKLSPAEFMERCRDHIPQNNWEQERIEKMLALIKDRCSLLTEVREQTAFFFSAPATWDIAAVKTKWNEQKKEFFKQLQRNWEITDHWTAPVLEANLQTTVVANQLKPGEVLLPLRIMLVGGKFGPGVFDIAEVLGKQETLSRIDKALSAFENS
jgi:glutamyl-tRNA synthetase